MFGKHILSFHESLLWARLWEHELFSVRSIAFISTVVKSPDEACNKYTAFCKCLSRGYYIGGIVSTTLPLGLESTQFNSLLQDWAMVRRALHTLFLFWQNDRTCVLSFESIFKMSQFQECRYVFCITSRHEPKTLCSSHIVAAN